MTPVPAEPEPGAAEPGDVFRAEAFEQLRSAAGHRTTPGFDDRSARRAFWAVAAIPLVAAAAAFAIRVDVKVPAPTQSPDRADLVVRSERLLVILVRPLFGGDEP